MIDSCIIYTYHNIINTKEETKKNEERRWHHSLKGKKITSKENNATDATDLVTRYL